MLEIGALPSLRPHQYKSRYFWNRIFLQKLFFHPHATSESAHGNYIFWNHSSELSRPLSTRIWVTKYEVFKMSEFINTVRVHTVLKSPWILGEVLEKSLNSIFPWKALKFLCKSLKIPWIFFNFKCGRLESVFWCFLVVHDRI